MKNKPNILFIMTDQQRWDTVGEVKPKKLKTPNLDRMVSEGCNFVNAFCQGPICIPSRASFLTGKYVHQHRLFHNNGILPDYETTWGDVLKDNGYRTFAVGRTHKIHKGFTHIPVPVNDSYFEEPESLNKFKRWIYGHEKQRVYPDKEEFVEFRRTKIACDLLKDLKDTGRPFALFLGYCAPHNPYIIPKPYDKMYNDADFPLPRVFKEDFERLDYDQREFYEKMQSLNPRKTARFYYSMASMIDECVGRVFERLKGLDILENTIVIFTSDHGEMLCKICQGVHL